MINLSLSGLEERPLECTTLVCVQYEYWSYSIGLLGLPVYFMNIEDETIQENNDQHREQPCSASHIPYCALCHTHAS